MLLPPVGSLIAFPDFVPTGFTQGILILDNNTTPMEFVASVLGSCLGSGPEDSNRTMLDIRQRGGALLSAEAAKHGYLVSVTR